MWTDARLLVLDIDAARDEEVTSGATEADLHDRVGFPVGDEGPGALAALEARPPTRTVGTKPLKASTPATAGRPSLQAIV